MINDDVLKKKLKIISKDLKRINERLELEVGSTKINDEIDIVIKNIKELISEK